MRHGLRAMLLFFWCPRCSRDREQQDLSRKKTIYYGGWMPPFLTLVTTEGTLGSTFKKGADLLTGKIGERTDFSLSCVGCGAAVYPGQPMVSSFGTWKAEGDTVFCRFARQRSAVICSDDSKSCMKRCFELLALVHRVGFDKAVQQAGPGVRKAGHKEMIEVIDEVLVSLNWTRAADEAVIYMPESTPLDTNSVDAITAKFAPGLDLLRDQLCRFACPDL